MDKKADSLIVVRGVMRTIEYAVCSNGSMPAKEFIESLSISEQAALASLFRRMADHGSFRNQERFKFIRGKIFEIKRHQLRVFCFRRGNRWFLTNGYKKKRSRLDPNEIARAKRVMAEHLERKAEKEGRRRNER